MVSKVSFDEYKFPVLIQSSISLKKKLKTRWKSLRVWDSVTKCCAVVMIGPHFGLSFLLAKEKKDTFLFFYFYLSLLLFMHLQTSFNQCISVYIFFHLSSTGETKWNLNCPLWGFYGALQHRSDFVLMAGCTYSSRALWFPS